MDKREFLKKACGLGVCSCAAAVLTPEAGRAGSEDAECEQTRDMNRRLEWRLNLAKRNYCSVLNKIEPEVDPKTRQNMLEQMGRNCANSWGQAAKFKNNPEGFFDLMRERFGENISFDVKGGLITVVTPERDCVCPIIDSSKAPAYYCHCSIGWQKQTYETILGRPVNVELKESVLRGSTRCVFEVRVV